MKLHYVKSMEEAADLALEPKPFTWRRAFLGSAENSCASCVSYEFG
jgi:hypothetical protein